MIKVNVLPNRRVCVYTFHDVHANVFPSHTITSPQILSKGLTTANNITNEPYWVLLSCRRSFCHTGTLLRWWISHSGMKLFKVWLHSATRPIKWSSSFSPSLPLFSAGSEPPRPQHPASAERDQTCAVLSSSDSVPELSLGNYQPLKPCKDKQSEEEEEEEEEEEKEKGKDELLKDKQKLGEAEEEEDKRRRLEGKQSAGERGDCVAGAGSCLPPDHTPGNPTCNLLLFISREIDWCFIVTCPSNAV